MVCVRGATTRLQGRTADVLAWLVKNGGEWCSHADLQLAGWPDEITNRGRVRCGQTALDRRLRQVIGELRKVLPGGVVESRRARSGVAGAYRVVHECRVAESRSSIALPMSNSKP